MKLDELRPGVVIRTEQVDHPLRKRALLVLWVEPSYMDIVYLGRGDTTGTAAPHFAAGVLVNDELKVMTFTAAAALWYDVVEDVGRTYGLW